MTRDLSNIIKAYDVRGPVPRRAGRRDRPRARRGLRALRRQPAIVLARDMRESGVELSRAFAEGATSQGVDVVDAGLGSTDLLYYAAGTLDVPGAMFTASHNPARYNGIKLCLAGAKAGRPGLGLAQLRADAERFLDEGLPAYDGEPGTASEQDLLAGYAAYMKELVPGLEGIRPLKVVVDAGNGMGGYTVPAVFEGLPLETTELYFELDGSFPNHEANPIDPANTADLQAKVRERGADIGWPSTATPTAASSSTSAARSSARRSHGADRRARAGQAPGRHRHPQPDHVQGRARGGHRAGRHPGPHPGRPLVHQGRDGRTGAIFGGEHSGHFYFAEFWNADSGCWPRCTPWPPSAASPARCPS
jgi:phosphomannomutase